ncbi:MAG: hypothetical protein JWN09_2938 [Microbacteriaceae bacterium]|nr:hypothetical protein [Microbacteriaceae bacterium]
MFGQAPVSLVTVFEHVEDACEVCFRGALVGGERVLFPIDVGESPGDAVLFGLEKVDGDRVGVVCLEELLSFPSEAVAFAI